MNSLSFTASALAERFGLALQGDGATQVTGVGTLAQAGPGQLAFLANPRYRPQLSTTGASVVVVGAEDAVDEAQQRAAGDQAAHGPTARLVAKDPYVAYAKIASLFEPQPVRAPGIHPSAVIDPTATVAPDAHVGPFVTIGARSTVGAAAIVGPHCIIGDDCSIGPGSELIARVTLVTRVRLGQRVRIHPGAVLGAEGFGLAMEAGRWIKVPQLGGVAIGDDCEIGANTCIDRGALEDTTLDEDVRLDNLIQIGHNVTVGAHTAMAGCVAVAGSAKIGRYCLIGGAAGILGHLEIVDRVTINAFSLVANSVKEPGEYTSGTPLTDSRTWRKNAARFKQLDALARRLPPAPKDPP